MVKRLAFERLVAKRNLRTEAPRRGECNHLVGRKSPFGEDVEHFTAYIAGGTDNSNFVTHRSLHGGSLGQIAPPVPPVTCMGTSRRDQRRVQYRCRFRAD